MLQSLVCSHPLFKCEDESNCVSKDKVCNGVNDCQDASDESDDFAGCDTGGGTGPVEVPGGVVAGIVVCCLLALATIVLGIIAAVIVKQRRQEGRNQQQLTENRRQQSVRSGDRRNVRNNPDLDPGQRSQSDDNIHRPYRVPNGLTNRAFALDKNEMQYTDPPKEEAVKENCYINLGGPTEHEEYARRGEAFQGQTAAVHYQAPGQRPNKPPDVVPNLYGRMPQVQDPKKAEMNQNEQPLTPAKLPYFHRSYDNIKLVGSDGKGSNILKPTPSAPSINDIGISPWSETNPINIDHHSTSLPGMGLGPVPIIGIPGEKSAFRRVNSAPLNLADSNEYYLYDTVHQGTDNADWRRPTYSAKFGDVPYGEITV